MSFIITLFVSALFSFGIQSRENKMLCQVFFTVTTGILAMFHGFDSHFAVCLCPSSPPTVNYCFASRAGTCSECLQAGVGCAYCTEEVR